MSGYLQIARFPLPDDLEPEGVVCVRFMIPEGQQYLGTLIGLLDMLKWSRNFALDDTESGAATVSRTWQSALESEPITVEGCDVPDFRINPETCLLEVDCSGEGDWQPVFTPAYDPATDAPIVPPYPDPPPEGQTNECLAAANAAAMLKAWGDEWAAEATGELPFVNLVSLLAHLVSVLMTLFIDIFIDNVTGVLLTLDIETLEADMNAITAQDIQDVLVCYFDSEGILQPDQFGDLIDALGDKIPENQAWFLIRMFVEMIGFVGVTLAAKISGITEGDCADCGQWVRHYRTTHSEWPQWVNGQPGTGYETEGEYIGGSGWSPSTYQSSGSTYTKMVVLHLTLSGMNLERIIVKAEGTSSTPSNGPLGFVIYDLQHAAYWHSDLVPDDTPFDITMDETGATESIMIQIGLDVEGSFAALAGSGFVYDIELRGTGTAPTGGI